ncbi:MAG: MBL fold metallo-hydrolase, partial [Psychrobacter celer]
MRLDKIVRLDGYIQSIYLAVYANKLLLLDGCCRADVPMVLAYITDTLQRPISQLKVVMVTHM